MEMIKACSIKLFNSTLMSLQVALPLAYLGGNRCEKAFVNQLTRANDDLLPRQVNDWLATLQCGPYET
jgi:hypothetical protein